MAEIAAKDRRLENRLEAAGFFRVIGQADIPVKRQGRILRHRQDRQARAVVIFVDHALLAPDQIATRRVGSADRDPAAAPAAVLVCKASPGVVIVHPPPDTWVRGRHCR